MPPSTRPSRATATPETSASRCRARYRRLRALPVRSCPVPAEWVLEQRSHPRHGRRARPAPASATPDRWIWFRRFRECAATARSESVRWRPAASPATAHPRSGPLPAHPARLQWAHPARTARRLGPPHSPVRSPKDSPRRPAAVRPPTIPGPPPARHPPPRLPVARPGLVRPVSVQSVQVRPVSTGLVSVRAVPTRPVPTRNAGIPPAPMLCVPTPSAMARSRRRAAVVLEQRCRFPVPVPVPGSWFRAATDRTAHSRTRPALHCSSPRGHLRRPSQERPPHHRTRRQPRMPASRNQPRPHLRDDSRSRHPPDLRVPAKTRAPCRVRRRRKTVRASARLPARPHPDRNAPTCRSSRQATPSPR
ncbi:hypothetical protein BC793_11790 [Actinoplanes xinjiangensis]|uniref:Uncharacterized protein n=1 Tax=Actinoplanes xinjiangensis TaxID=512350 RepID=A0A316F7F4_9ACTN|nr:hypothetical protein BC793_11790 [Actinoplanes xinjiangensis]